MNLFFKECLAVAIGGAIGSLARFSVSRWIQATFHHTDYPWGIFVVNVTGCLIIGILYGLLVHRLEVNYLWRSLLLIGFLGGYTTFSSFSLDTVVLIQSGAFIEAFANIILSVGGCLMATTIGMWLARI